MGRRLEVVRGRAQRWPEWVRVAVPWAGWVIAFVLVTLVEDSVSGVGRTIYLCVTSAVFGGITVLLWQNRDS